MIFGRRCRKEGDRDSSVCQCLGSGGWATEELVYDCRQQRRYFFPLILYSDTADHPPF